MNHESINGKFVPLMLTYVFRFKRNGKEKHLSSRTIFLLVTLGVAGIIKRDAECYRIMRRTTEFSSSETKL